MPIEDGVPELGTGLGRSGLEVLSGLHDEGFRVPGHRIVPGIAEISQGLQTPEHVAINDGR